MVGLIRRSFSYLSPYVFKKLYLALVRPHLEYAQVVWSPQSKKMISMIENVQIRATKLVDGLGSLEYHERLQELKLPTLQHRRLRGAMIEFYKHFNTYAKHTLPRAFQPRQRSTRSHCHQILERRARDGITGVQSRFFYFRHARDWNTLPHAVVTATSLNCFKNRLDKHWENVALTMSNS